MSPSSPNAGKVPVLVVYPRFLQTKAETICLLHPRTKRDRRDLVTNNPPTGGFSRPHLVRRCRTPAFKSRRTQINLRALLPHKAGSTGLEPATSPVTGERSNQLSYDPTKLLFTTDKLFSQTSLPRSLCGQLILF